MPHSTYLGGGGRGVYSFFSLARHETGEFNPSDNCYILCKESSRPEFWNLRQRFLSIWESISFYRPVGLIPRGDSFDRFWTTQDENQSAVIESSDLMRNISWLAICFSKIKKPKKRCSGNQSVIAGVCIAEILGDPYSKKSPLPRIGNTPCLSVTPSLPGHRILGKAQILNRIFVTAKISLYVESDLSMYFQEIL